VAEHGLKIWPEFYDAIAAGAKTWEYRRDDRGFQIGDVLVLQYWRPSDRFSGGEYGYNGRNIKSQRVRVTYIIHGGRCGIPEHFCVMSIVPEAGEEERDG